MRLGQATVGKCRPVKIVLSSEREKENLMANLSALKDNEFYNGVSITEDLTQTQRKAYKELAQTAKSKNIEESEYTWGVRGNSKNGFHLKKFHKGKRQERDPQQQQNM